MHVTVFTFGQGNTYSQRTQRKMSCGFPCEGLIRLVMGNIWITNIYMTYITVTALILLFYLFP